MLKEDRKNCPIPKWKIGEELKEGIEKAIEKEYYYNNYKMLVGDRFKVSDIHRKMITVLNLGIYLMSCICPNFKGKDKIDNERDIESVMNKITKYIKHIVNIWPM